MKKNRNHRNNHKRKWWRFVLCILVVCIPGGSLGMSQPPVYAAEREGRLIQTTTLGEEYSGRIYCRATATKPLETEDEAAAYQTVKPSLVKLRTDTLSGSGIVWEMEEDRIVIASNRHVLEGWNEDSIVSFSNAGTAHAALLGLSEEADVGFLAVSTNQLTAEELLYLSKVNAQTEAYQRLKINSRIFIAGSADGPGANRYDGRTIDTAWYVDAFEEEMLYCYGFAKPGMSGSGTFDAYGCLVGMLSAGDGGDQTVSVPVKKIMEEYEKVMD